MAITRSVNKRNWSAMPYDILVHIFTMINVLDRTTNVAAVCGSWRSAASDKRLSKTLNIAECRELLKPGTTKKRAKLKLELVFARGINLGGFRLTTLVFDPSFQVTNKHLRYASQRCPNLQNLVLPFPNSTSEACMDRALRLWLNLESFHFPCHGFRAPASFLQMVGLNCPRLRVFKVSCSVFGETQIEAIINFMPRLKVLSVRCAMVDLNMVEAFSSIATVEEVYISIIHFLQLRTVNLQLLPSAVNDARKLKSFPSLQVFHVCTGHQYCSNLCMAATMGDPPLNIPDPFPWLNRSTYIWGSDLLGY